MSVTLATEAKPERLKTIQELHPILMSTNEVVVLDIETTGFSPDKFAEIIEIGAVKLDIDKRAIVGGFHQLIRPSNMFNIPPKIQDLTQITWPQVEDAPYIEEVLPSFARFLGDDPIVAHNALFDWPRFLVPAFRSVGLHATNEAICSMNLAKALYPGRGKSGYNLESLCAMMGHAIEGHHQAYVDCKWTASLLLNMLSEYRNRFAAETPSMFNSAAQPNPAPSMVGSVDFNALKVFRVSYDKGQSKRHGPRIYVSTNFGRLVYSVRRHLWTVVDLWTEENAPAQLWGAQVLKILRMDASEFEKAYQPAS